MLKPNNSYDFFWKSNFSDVQMSASKALRNNSFELCSRPLIDSASNTRHRQMSSHISRQWVGSFLISSTHPECQDPESTVTVCLTVFFSSSQVSLVQVECRGEIKLRCIDLFVNLRGPPQEWLLGNFFLTLNWLLAGIRKVRPQLSLCLWNCTCHGYLNFPYTRRLLP